MSERCSEEVYRDWSHSRCHRNGTKEHNGKWYCGTHHPDAVQARRVKWQEKYDKDIAERSAKWEKQALDAKRAEMFPELVEALQAMLNRDDSRTCRHEETHRGGIIWTICDQCGDEWADDRGGKPDFVEPEEWKQSKQVLAKSKALL